MQKKGGNNWIKGYSDLAINEHLVDNIMQTEYLITVYGDLRDTFFEETLKSFMKWINRLAKRVYVDEVNVKIYNCYYKKSEYYKEINIDLSGHNQDFDDVQSWIYRLKNSIR